jgi:tight adherence protein C
MSLTASQLTLVMAAAAFLALFLMCLGLLQYVRQITRRREIVEKIKRGGESSGLLYGSAVAEVNGGGLGNGVTGLLRALGRYVAPARSADYSKVRIKFLKAGIRTDSFTALFWGAKILLAALLPSIFLVFRFTLFNVLSPQVTVAIEVLAALAGYYLPDFLLKVRTDSRKEKIQKALPDALDLLVVCVQAGMGLDGAVNRVAQEIKLTSPELSDELGLLNLELRAGKARQDALRNLAVRTDLDAVNSLVTLLVQTDKFGTSISSALKVFADGFRTQRFQKAEELAAKMPVKLIFPLIFFIFPALFVIIAAPAAIKIYQNIIMR